jgi:hypothetical protein
LLAMIISRLGQFPKLNGMERNAISKEKAYFHLLNLTMVTIDSAELKKKSDYR